jgi:hypothetical protein
MRVIKSRRIRWVGHVACMEDKAKLWLEKLKGRDHLEELGLDRKIVLKNLRETEWKVVDFYSSGSGQGPVAVAGSCEHGNKLSGSIKEGGENF